MFKVLTEGCTPTRGTKYSACVDLYASEDVLIGAGETKVVGLGIAIDKNNLFKNYIQREGFSCTIGEGPESQYMTERNFGYFLNSHYLQVALRSSLGKDGLIMPNGVGIIDMDYKDEIKVIIHNPLNLDDAYQSANSIEPEGYKISKGQRIAQTTLLEHKSYLFGIESDVVRDGGLGSTNTAS